MTLDLSGGASEALPASRLLVWCSGAPWPVAGLELWRRAVYMGCRAGFERLLVVAADGADALRRELSDDPRLQNTRWEVVSASRGWVESVRRDPGRWVVLLDQWVVDGAHLRELAATRGEPTAAGRGGPIAADAADLVSFAAGGWTPLAEPPRGPRQLDEPPLYVRVGSSSDVRAAEAALFQNLARNTTNLFARYVDRAMSRAISRRLAPFPVTPNQITIFSIGLGIVGALCLLRPTYGFGLLGSFLFLASTIIDGCDGEIARLKFQESAEGARLDVIGDNVVHAVLFPCVALHAYFADPGGPYLWLGAIALGGVVVTWWVVYRFIVRSVPSPRMAALFEAFGNREFAYLFFVLGVAGALHWFVWSMAFGLWIFWIALLVLRATEE